jgi:hypothetical protein
LKNPGETRCSAALAMTPAIPETATTSPPATALPGRGINVVARIATFLLVAFLIGALLDGLARRLDRSMQPAGFVRGLIQGALMPAAMPNLLLGRDIVIYSPNNTGVTYKLGYTLGVNVCGALFFGLFYWRLKRWRDRR